MWLIQDDEIWVEVKYVNTFFEASAFSFSATAIEGATRWDGRGKNENTLNHWISIQRELPLRAFKAPTDCITDNKLECVK